MTKPKPQFGFDKTEIAIFEKTEQTMNCNTKYYSYVLVETWKEDRAA